MRIIINLQLIFITTSIRAQQMISVIDQDTRNPIWRAYFIHDGDTIAYTSPEGIAILPKVSGIILIVCPDYKRVTFNSDSIPDVIHLKSELEQLEEITVIGDKDKVKHKPEKWDHNEPFKARKPRDWLGEGGAGIGIDVIFRAVGYRPASEKRRNRVKKKLEEYDKKINVRKTMAFSFF